MHKIPLPPQVVRAQFNAPDGVAHALTGSGERALAPHFIEHLLAMPRAANALRQTAEKRAAFRLRHVVLE